MESSDGIRTISCRIPSELRDQISDLIATHPERPSYGQVIFWSCEDHPDRVAGRAITHLLDKRRERSARRGRGGAGRRTAIPTVPLTPRLWPEELAAVDAVHTLTQERLATAPELAGATVNRTHIVIAAFHVALETTPPPHAEPRTS